MNVLQDLKSLKLFSRWSRAEASENAVECLKEMYKNKVRPLESTYLYDRLQAPPLGDSYFEAKPTVLLVGQYSTGKSSFIRHMLGSGYPGMLIGPEPTTDSFVSIMHGEREHEVSGNVLVADATCNFKSLEKFGSFFLDKFKSSRMPSEVLRSISIVDTPGILSGEQERLNRGYDFEGVLEWFADQSDRIVLLFDANKLDISDQYKRCIKMLMKSNSEKLRFVLNKADLMSDKELIRVHGALLWSLGKVIKTPEIPRVFMGSFWSRPYQNDAMMHIFEQDAGDLFNDLKTLPKNSTLHKLDDLVKRARLAKVNAYIVSRLREQMPMFLWKGTKKTELIKNLDQVCAYVSVKYDVSLANFPDVQSLRRRLEDLDFSRFPALDEKLIQSVDDMLANDVTSMMSLLSSDDDSMLVVRGGVFEDQETLESSILQGFSAGKNESEWIVERFRYSYDKAFDEMEKMASADKVSEATARAELSKSKLPNPVLAKICRLADVDKDQALDKDEWALASYLLRVKLEGWDLPHALPSHLTPPSKLSM